LVSLTLYIYMGDGSSHLGVAPVGEHRFSCSGLIASSLASFHCNTNGMKYSVLVVYEYGNTCKVIAYVEQYMLATYSVPHAMSDNDFSRDTFGTCVRQFCTLTWQFCDDDGKKPSPPPSLLWCLPNCRL
jgi:hypothetical protein